MEIRNYIQKTERTRGKKEKKCCTHLQINSAKVTKNNFPRYRKVFWIGALVLVTFMGFQIGHMEEPGN